VKYRALISVVAVGLALAGCTRSGGSDGGPPGSAGRWGPAGTLRIAMVGAPNTLNPILSTQEVEVTPEALVMDPLIATEPDGRLVPILAQTVPTLENGGIGRDGVTITYHLRHGVKWQDGAPFTSHDVAFTVSALNNPKTLVGSRHGYDQIARVDTPDPYTAVFRLKHPFAPAVNTFFAHSDAPYFVLPAHLLEREPNLNHVAFNEHPIGTGPFKLVRWYRGDRIEYAANDDYFLGKPKLRTISLRIIPDENTAVNQLRAHEVDWIALGTPRMYTQLKTIPGVEVRLVPFNGNDAIQFNVQRAPVDDARVRRAIGLAIDKPRLTHEVTFDTTVPAQEDLPPLLWAYDPRAGTSRRDLPGAKALLEAAGWHAGPDGVRLRQGRRFTMGLAFRSDSITDRNRGVQIASMLREAGIEVELKGYTTALLYGPPGTGVMASGRFDAALQTWYAGTDPDNSTQLLCREVRPKGFNWSAYCNAELDAAENDALTHYDRPTRKRAYARIEQLLARDAPSVYLWWPRQIEAVNAQFRNFRPNGMVETWNAWEWSI
jgi:peptide/nickel transport system substrate-binding protein